MDNEQIGSQIAEMRGLDLSGFKARTDCDMVCELLGYTETIAMRDVNGFTKVKTMFLSNKCIQGSYHANTVLDAWRAIYAEEREGWNDTLFSTSSLLSTYLNRIVEIIPEAM